MTSGDISTVPSDTLSYFLEECNSTPNNYYDNVHSEEFNGFPNPINSEYYAIGQFNSIKHDPTSSFSLFHTNLASINKHLDDMQNILSCLKTKFDIIGITEHKIKKEHNTPVLNINLDGYHPFIFDTSDTNCGGTGLYIKDSIVFNKRDDLKFSSSGDFESSFVEIILPSKKNLIVGCIYRHPSSNISINQFNNDYIEPLLEKITSENKPCALMGDFNINLLNSETDDGSNLFFNNLTSNCFTPYIMQPPRLVS